MQVVLLERVEKLGQIGDVVKVKDGFARNSCCRKRRRCAPQKRIWLISRPSALNWKRAISNIAKTRNGSARS